MSPFSVWGLIADLKSGIGKEQFAHHWRSPRETDGASTTDKADREGQDRARRKTVDIQEWQSWRSFGCEV